MLWRNVRQRVRRDKNFTHKDHKGHEDRFGLEGLRSLVIPFLCDLCVDRLS